jgi:D-threo-aldose 1-dehydrogenase
MQRITLNTTSVQTSPLGFGCVTLTRHDRREDAVRFLEQVYEAGVTHYDVARLYGFGQAEGILGGFLAGKRDKVTVASKFGLQASGALTKSRRLVSIARKLHQKSKIFSKMAKRFMKSSVKQGAFSPADAAASLETSLRELGTDYLDIYFLHECTLADAAREDLIAYLSGEVDKGRIRAVGTATGYEALRGDAGLFPRRYNVMQFASSSLKPNILSLKNAQERGLITFGAVSGARRLADAARGNAALLGKYRERVGADLSNATVVAGLMLRHSAAMNPRGITLFSSTSAENVRANAAAMEGSGPGEAALRTFAEFVVEADKASPAA